MSEEMPIVIRVVSILPIILIAMRFVGFFDFFSSDSENETASETESIEKNEFSDPIIPDDSSKNFKSGLELDPYLKKKLKERGIISAVKNK